MLLHKDRQTDGLPRLGMWHLITLSGLKQRDMLNSYKIINLKTCVTY